MSPQPLSSFFFNHPPTTEIYTLSLHDALPIFATARVRAATRHSGIPPAARATAPPAARPARSTSWRRSEEHTSELQSHVNLVCRLLLEKKKKTTWHQKIVPQEKSREIITSMPT